MASFFANVISNWSVATTQNTSALLKAQDLQIAKMNSSSFAMTHKMAIVDMTINTEGRLTSTQLYNYASVSFVGANNTSPLLLDDSSTLHAYSILTPRTLSGNFATITLDNLIKYYSYSQMIDNEKIYAFSVTRDVTLPVDYVARYNMASTTAFATSDSPNSSAYWNAANAVSNFTSKTLSSITCRNKTVSNWHLPSAEEWMSVIPTYYTKSEIATAGNSSIDVGGEENSIRFTFTNGDANHTPIVHYSGLYEVISWGKTSGSYEINHRKFYNEYYSPNTGSSNGGIAYGIRFKDSDGGKGQGYGLYTTAMRCEYRKDYPASGNYSLILRWKYLGPGNSTTMDNIIVESYWSSYDGQIIIPACGLLGSSKTSWPAGSYSSQSANTARGDYWAVTQFSDTYWTHMHFITGWAYSPRWENPLSCLTIRLFADVE